MSSGNDDETETTVAQQAAEHARRLLHRPGLLAAVRVAEASKPPQPTTPHQR